MGSGGDVSLKFANFLKHMWSGEEEKIYPVKLLKTLSECMLHM